MSQLQETTQGPSTALPSLAPVGMTRIVRSGAVSMTIGRWQWPDCRETPSRKKALPIGGAPCKRWCECRLVHSQLE